eukprot:TRINITY_DN5502_c1_g1_i7.p1 TRINITY_DN5502_c1_g1~~TRINITY_DN5502_c1_g1_i7.p1  ORF type:complete len:445 (-),score=52.52 TRINITY_DN5502_c1_g1_i7:235-1569(-)
MQLSNGPSGRLHFPVTNDRPAEGGKNARRQDAVDDAVMNTPLFSWWDERILFFKYPYNQRKLNVAIDLDCDYVRQLVIDAFNFRKDVWDMQVMHDQHGGDEASDLTRNVDLFWGEYERVHWDQVLEGKQYVGCYCVRKGLIRKAHLAFNIKKWASKRGQNGVLTKSVPLTLIMDLPDIDYFDESMSDLPEIRGLYPNGTPQLQIRTWIAKPSIINQANAIFIFKIEEELRLKLEEQPDLREWVIQQYIENPLLINNRKFHIRTYVLCVGNLDVYVYKSMLALFASQQYQQSTYNNLNSHLTNTCRVQNYVQEEDIVRLLDEVVQQGQDVNQLQYIHQQIYDIVGECFECVSNELSFQALPNAFELFGFDFLVSEDGQVWLLEANAEPDLKQTGNRLKQCMEGLIEGIMRLAIDRFACSLGQWDGRMEPWGIKCSWRKVFSKAKR